MAKKEADNNLQQNMIDPKVLQAMYAMPEEDEIDLLEYWNVLWKRRFLILGASFFASVLAAGVSLTMPNVYKAEALLAPVEADKNKGSNLSSVLGGLGGIASLAGVSVGGGSSVEENIAVLKSREFIWGFVKDEELMPLLFESAWDVESKEWKVSEEEARPTLWDAWRLLIEGSVLSIDKDKESGLILLSIEWVDPELAAIWADKIVRRINKHLREKAVAQSQRKLKYLNEELSKTRLGENRQALFDLISAEQKQAMLANTQQDFAFRVLDPAVVPDKKVKPKRSMIVALTAFVVGFLAIVLVFIQEGLRKWKEEMGADDL